MILGRYATRAEARHALEEYAGTRRKKSTSHCGNYIQMVPPMLLPPFPGRLWTTTRRYGIRFAQGSQRLQTNDPGYYHRRPPRSPGLLAGRAGGESAFVLLYFQNKSSSDTAMELRPGKRYCKQKLCEAGKTLRKDTGPKTKKRALTDLEFATLEQHWRDVPGGDACYALCYLGFRVSEFCALTRFSYDPKAQTLTGGLKTDAGRGRVVRFIRRYSPLSPPGPPVDAIRYTPTIRAGRTTRINSGGASGGPAWRPSVCLPI